MTTDPLNETQKEEVLDLIDREVMRFADLFNVELSKRVQPPHELSASAALQEARKRFRQGDHASWFN